MNIDSKSLIVPVKPVIKPFPRPDERFARNKSFDIKEYTYYTLHADMSNARSMILNGSTDQINKCRDKDGRNALLIACEDDLYYTIILEILNKKGYIIDDDGELVEDTKKIDVNSVDNFGKTPLHYLAERFGNNSCNYILVINEIIKRGADINAVDKKHNTPFHLAVSLRNSNFINIITENIGFDPLTFWSKNSDGETPYEIAKKNKFKEFRNVLEKFNIPIPEELEEDSQTLEEISKTLEETRETLDRKILETRTQYLFNTDFV